MVVIELQNPCWINGASDDTHDYCAHGNIKFEINGMSLTREDEWTVSGAALFLLRSVFHNHSKANSVAERNMLIPCCGFTPYKDSGERFGLLLLGCNNGLDPEITHEGSQVLVEHMGDSRSLSIPC